MSDIRQNLSISKEPRPAMRSSISACSQGPRLHGPIGRSTERMPPLPIKGKMEIELQPAGRLRDSSGTSLIGPAARFNYGLTDTWEAVLEGQIETPLSPTGPSNLTAAGAFLKSVLRPGSLQDKTGPSVATEFGVLLPDSNGDSRIGASLAGIVSQRWDWGAIHLNGATALTRDQHADLFAGAII